MPSYWLSVYPWGDLLLGEPDTPAASSPSWEQRGPSPKSMLMSSKGKQTLGSGRRWPRLQPRLLAMLSSHCSSAGVGEVPGSWGPHTQGVFLRGHLPLRCSSLCQFCSWHLVLKVSLPLFPGPALPSGHPETWREGGLPSPGGACHHPSQRYSQPWQLAACAGARTSLCLTSFLSLPAQKRCLWHRVGGERSAQRPDNLMWEGNAQAWLAHGVNPDARVPLLPRCPHSHACGLCLSGT